ncbi:hypothetical protein Bealeia1_00361 [Candidatus Bealeia paramacronuclearis]|uniref:Organic solvent tolerance-like N-terminal domain-containing protein n=1 Tax=Candidatus Bealeia paramacronuclearis TaxID=1921001 RepID=A0ABZ2C1D4_9PROT|nr:hypothetical protein [Candidatus Bealeia paramacronuclearis]
MTKKIVFMSLALSFSVVNLSATIYWTKDDLDFTRSIRKITEIGEVRDGNNRLIHQNVCTDVEYFDGIVSREFYKLQGTACVQAESKIISGPHQDGKNPHKHVVIGKVNKADFIRA